jgi:hypothetical protein
MNLSSISEIKEKISIVDFLQRLGYSPVRRSGHETFFRSMIRDGDSDPSFAVNHRTNLWYDHGLGEGGSIIDLAMRIYRTDSIPEAISSIRDLYGGGTNLHLPILQRDKQPPPPKNVVTAVKPLEARPVLLEYLRSRGVLEQAIQLGRLHAVEFDRIGEDGERKHLYGVGWQNNSGGWEVRNRYGKNSIKPKDFLHIESESHKVHIFEGMMDYLSALKEYPEIARDHTFLLNGLGMAERVINRLKEMNSVRDISLYLDHGTGGYRFRDVFKGHFPHAKDMAYLYAGFGDYNEKIKHRLLVEFVMDNPDLTAPLGDEPDITIRRSR